MEGDEDWEGRNRKSGKGGNAESGSYLKRKGADPKQETALEQELFSIASWAALLWLSRGSSLAVTGDWGHSLVEWQKAASY